MAPRDTVQPDEHNEPGPARVETYWQVRGSSGKVFECAVYQLDVGLELRVTYDSNPVSAVPLASVDEGRARAATLKGLVLGKGGFDELPA